MKAIILAAGRGSRMDELTAERPKCLIELGGRPLIDWQLDALRSAGVSDVGLVTGYRSEALAHLGLHEFHNSRWNETNMVSSLACAAAWLREDFCLVSYSDIFFEASAVTSLLNTQAQLALTYDPEWFAMWKQRFHDPLVDAESFRLSPDGSLAEIGKRISNVSNVDGQYMGLLRFSPATWKEVELIRSEMTTRRRDGLDMTSLLQEIIERKRTRIDALPYKGKWGEIDSPSDVLVYEASHSGFATPEVS